jgi:transglutaminase-like putative cysteine protease
MSHGYAQCAIRHLTRFAYSVPISESVMEARMQPRSDGRQRCLRFEITTMPRSRVFSYQDPLGNTVHHFDIPNRHNRLSITAEGIVEMAPVDEMPERLPDAAWDQVDAIGETGEHWDALAFSRFACDTPQLRDFAREIDLGRHADPLTVVRQLTSTVYDALEYAPRSTRVDSPIDHALEARAGVCQDFAHIMTALVRKLGIPCRYVSGYLWPSRAVHDRSTPGATHAWIEAFLPELGWAGFDPTNNGIAGERHIRVAVGRDYSDVPPTHGVFKGETRSELSVAVAVVPAGTPMKPDLGKSTATWTASEPAESPFAEQAQQQQQQ